MTKVLQAIKKVQRLTHGWMVALKYPLAGSKAEEIKKHAKQEHAGRWTKGIRLAHRQTHTETIRPPGKCT